MKDEIKAIIEERVSIWYAANDKGDDLDLAHFALCNVNAATEAIVKLIERQPVDKVRAMAALVQSGDEPNVYLVPDASGTHAVICVRGIHWRCWKEDGVALAHCDSVENEQLCDHIQAVEYHLAAAQEAK